MKIEEGKTGKEGKDHGKKSDKGSKASAGEEPENCLSFKELMVGLSIISRGTEDEKLNCMLLGKKKLEILLTCLVTFNMYDLDNDGFVTRQEVTTIMTALNKLTGNLTTHSEKVYYSVEQAVRIAFLILLVTF